MSQGDFKSIDDLRALGEILRQAREMRALTLEEAEAQTRIRAKFLEALESGNFSLLPSATHAKGFLRNYAQFLQLDANAIVTRFSDLSGERSKPITTSTAAPRPKAPPQYTPSAPSSPPSSPSPPPPTPYPSTPAAPQPQSPQQPPSPYPQRSSTYVIPSQRVGPSGPLGLSGEQAPPRTMPAAPQQPQPAEAQPPSTLRRAGWQANILTAFVLLGGFAAILWWTTTQLSTLSISDIVPTEQGSSLLQEFAGSATATTATPTFEPTATEVEGSGPVAFNRVTIKISVTQRSWTRIEVDGEIVFEGQLEPGMLVEHTAEESIVVLTGNGAALSVTYNGQRLGPLGERGQVVKRFFTTNGQLTPTATMTVTTTPTSVPTSTPRFTETPTP